MYVSVLVWMNCVTQQTNISQQTTFSFAAINPTGTALLAGVIWGRPLLQKPWMLNLGCGYFAAVSSWTIKTTGTTLTSRSAYWKHLQSKSLSGDIISIENIILEGLQEHLLLLMWWGKFKCLHQKNCSLSIKSIG